MEIWMMAAVFVPEIAISVLPNIPILIPTQPLPTPLHQGCIRARATRLSNVEQKQKHKDKDKEEHEPCPCPCPDLAFRKNHLDCCTLSCPILLMRLHPPRMVSRIFFPSSLLPCFPALLLSFFPSLPPHLPAFRLPLST